MWTVLSTCCGQEDGVTDVPDAAAALEGRETRGWTTGHH